MSAPEQVLTPIAGAIGELSKLPDGTALSISITDTTATLSAGGMRAITLTLPAGRVTVDSGLSDRMHDLAELLADAHGDGEELGETPWFFIESLLITAGESGVTLDPVPASQLVPEPEGGKLAAIRAVLAEFDWETDDRQYALERIDQIATGTRVESGPEPGGGAYLVPADLVTALAALDQAADRKRARAAGCPDCMAHPADLCDGCDRNLAQAVAYDALAAKLGGAL